MTPTTVEHLGTLGDDRFVAFNAWLSTGKHRQAYTCHEDEIYRIIRFCMRGARSSKPARRPHASPFGHPQLSFLIQDIPLYAAEQWLRHRTQNFSKDSFRYGTLLDGRNEDSIPMEMLNFQEVAEIVYIPSSGDVRSQVGYPGDYNFPSLIDTNPDAVDRGRRMAYEASLKCLDTYEKLIDMGWAPEIARGYLPTATLCSFTATASLRNWLNFLVLRASEDGDGLTPQAQLEIRQPADMVEGFIKEQFPITHASWTATGRPVL